MKHTLFFLFLLLGIQVMKADNYVGSVAACADSWLSTQNTQIILPATASTRIVNIDTNLKLTFSSRPATWISITQVATGQLKLTAKANKTSKARSINLALTGKDGTSATLSITQYCPSITSVTTNKDEVDFFADKKQDSLVIWANTDYTLECPEWVQCQQETDSMYYFSTTENIYDARSKDGFIYIKNGETILDSVKVSLKYDKALWYQKPFFASVSDIHFGDTNAGYWYNRAPKWMTTLNSYRPKLPYIFVVGDLGDSGQEAQYQNVNAYWSKYIDSDIQRICVRGNHDHKGGNTGVTAFSNLISNMYNFYLDIQGYPFIALGLGYDLYSGETHNEETYAFLRKNLADAAKRYPDKPIFVFTHTLPKFTIIGSYDTDYGAYDTEIDGIFRDYPQVINISGHTHMGIMDPHNIYQKYYTALNDGSSKSDSHPTYFPGKNQLNASSDVDYYLTEGLICHINEDDEVVFERWNTARNVKYDEDWVIRPPFNTTDEFTYTPDRTGGANPWWPDDAAIEVTNMASTSCRITFPNAIDDNEGVNRYIISFTNANTGATIRSSINQSSLQYMCNQRPEKITIPVSSLVKGVPIKISVQARDYYELASPQLSTTVTLP